MAYTLPYSSVISLLNRVILKRPYVGKTDPRIKPENDTMRNKKIMGMSMYKNELFAETASVTQETYKQLIEEAASDYQGYWGRLAKENLQWKQPFTQSLDETQAPHYKWFADGKLNVSYNCLDIHLQSGNAKKTAIVFEADDGKVTRISFQELHKRVCKLANGLKSLGVTKGDRVVIYMPMSIEGIVAMQACARIGAIHSVVFGGFSAKSLQERIIDAQATLVITADEQARGGRYLPLKTIADEALNLGGCDSVRHVVVYQRSKRPVPLQDGRDIWLHELIENQEPTCEPEWVEAEHPLFILYTSGSTGAPKGVQHSSAGYLLHAILTMKWAFDIKPADIFWCTADIGWITGHTYMAYGPLATGATQVIFEGIPTYPDASRFWRMIQAHKVTIFYTAPTAIRSLIRASSNTPTVAPKNFNLSSLRLLGSVGEPISPEAWEWFYEEVGNQLCPVIDTFWQTETGGHMIVSLPGAHDLVPGSCGLPFPGIDIAVVDEVGQEVPHGTQGYLVIRKPWPSMIRNVWGDADRYKGTYFPDQFDGKLYLAGDGAVRDKETGYFSIIGRVDDVLNVSGHRLGTAEIEAALATHSAVAEAAVVGCKDPITGEAVFTYVVMRGSIPEGEEAIKLSQELRNWVGRELSPIAKPAHVIFVEAVPKTRSGKIMRRLLKSIANKEDITQDISTLDNPAVVEQIRLKVQGSL